MVNKAELRQFITQYFSDLELDELCFDYYPDLLNQFTTGMTKSQKVIALIGYCDRRGLTNHLLTTLAKLRAAAYQNQFDLVPKQQAQSHAAGRNPNQIFLSHANQDADFARELADDLRHNGFDIWMAPESIEPGEKWVNAIERGLETSGIFVLVITPHAADSKWVRDESNYAITLQNKDEMRFFTLLVGEGRMPPMWSVRQHISFREDYDEGLRELLAALRPDRFAASPASPPVAAAPPPVAAAPPPVETSEALPLAESKPAPRKPRAAKTKKAMPETSPASEAQDKPEAAAARTTTTLQPAPNTATTESLKPARPVPAGNTTEAQPVAEPAIERAPGPGMSNSGPGGHYIEPAPAPESPTAKPARGKPLYWALGLVAVVAVAFIGWRLMAAGAGGGSGSEVSDITPVTRSVEESGAGTDPTRTPTRRPTEAPTATSTRQPTRTSTPTQKPDPTSIPTEQPAQAGDIRTVSRGGVEVEQVFVPAGSFMMGSEDGYDDERPVHEVTLDAFWIDRTEVTNAQFAACVAVGRCQAPSDRSSYNGYGNTEYADHPVIYVDWSDANKFCQWAGGRLPTEAEWEYAARGPESFTFPWGNQAASCDLLNYNSDCVGDTSRVGSYPDGESWVGALDMSGNVWEWVNDWYDSEYYGNSPGENPPGPASGEIRVLRGGAWYSNGFSARSSFRFSNQPDFHYFSIGFRCAQE